MSDGATIVWFRQDLRLRDNPALHAAAALDAPVVPVYIWSPEEEADWTPGGASHKWVPELANVVATSGATSRPQRGLFDSYPEPIVDLSASRAAALEAYHAMRSV